jgi:hypothetical protein
MALDLDNSIYDVQITALNEIPQTAVAIRCGSEFAIWSIARALGRSIFTGNAGALPWVNVRASGRARIQFVRHVDSARRRSSYQ